MSPLVHASANWVTPRPSSRFLGDDILLEHSHPAPFAQAGAVFLTEALLSPGHAPAGLAGSLPAPALGIL